ncbi:MAG: hypothetical protein WCG55_04600 [bacterium]
MEQIRENTNNSISLEEREALVDMPVDAVREVPTQEKKQSMDAQLVALGKLFEGSHIRWVLDGARTISFMKGSYIGIHKDVDISIEKNEITKIHKHLEQNGYGLFLNYPKDLNDPKSRVVMERIKTDTGRSLSLGELMIIAIDDKGFVTKDKHLNFIDVHVINRDQAGEPVGLGGTTLPREWFEFQTTQFQGTEIHASHPAKVAYFKLHNDRARDMADLHELAKIGMLSDADVSSLEEVCREESQAREDSVRLFLKGVFSRVASSMSAETIFEILATEPAAKDTYQRNPALLKNIAEAMYHNMNNQELVVHGVCEILGFPQRDKKMKLKIEQVRQWMKGGN